jgi:hypothetical protein
MLIDSPQAMVALAPSKSRSCLSALSDEETEYVSLRETNSTVGSEIDYWGSKMVSGRPFSMDLHICNISLQPVAHACPGMAHLVIAFKKAKAAAQYHAGLALNALEKTLLRLDRACVTFAITYDFRNNPLPMVELIQGFSRLHHKCESMLAQQLVAIAMLVPDNLYTMPAKGSIRNFLRESNLPSCPHLIAHQEFIAEEFFRLLSCPSIPVETDEFVSLTGVRKSADTQKVQETCIAKLVPFRHQHDTRDNCRPSVALEPVMHALDNGDVRVIQTPAADVMIRQGSPRKRLELQPTLDVDSSKDSLTTPASSLQEKPSSTDLQELQVVKALKFQCDGSKLQELVGTTFSMRELTIDAESVSKILQPPQAKKKPTKQRQQVRSSDFTKEVQVLCSDGCSVVFECMKPLVLCRFREFKDVLSKMCD